jgi:IS30 family transposase
MTAEIKKRIVEKLTKEHWSPKQIVGFAELNNISMVSHELINQLIRQDKKEGGLLCTYTRY